MKFGFTHLSVIPVRAENREQSEMVTQLLFGDLYQVISLKEKWVQIKIEDDGYEGFIDRLMFNEVSEIEYQQLNQAKAIYTSNLWNQIHIDEQNFSILQGSRLPLNDKAQFTVAQQKYICDTFEHISETNSRENIRQTAMSYLNSPYLWGGKTHFGIDCSGFTQMVYKINGMQIPRDASQQVGIGKSRNFADEAELGDLAFFDNEEGYVIHVGIVLGDRKIIHASGKVRIDTLDHQGIYNEDLKKYTHRLRVIQNLL